MALAFRDSAALEVAIRSGLVTRDAAAGSARLARGRGDAIVIEPDARVPAAMTAQLRAAGVDVDAALPAPARAIRCWAEAIAPVRVPVRELPAIALFETQTAAELIDLAAELVRLGCDRQELRVVGAADGGGGADGAAEGAAARGMLRAIDPPTYTLVRALDREGGLRVFAPDPAAQDRVWTELGYHHALAEHLRTEAGALLLCAGDGWRSVTDGGWLGLDAALELAVPGRAEPHAIGAFPARRRVELRLARGRGDAPSLWVIRGDAVAAIDRLLAYLPDEVVERLEVAVTAATPPVAIVRARTGRHAPPDLALSAEAYAPLAGMPDVFAPAGAIVEPPLRRERLREVLGAHARDVLWLAPAEASPSAFRVERIAEAAFAPLAEWAEYVLHANAPALEPWLRAEVDFAPFVAIDSAAAPADREAREARRRRAQAAVLVEGAAAASESAATGGAGAGAGESDAGDAGAFGDSLAASDSSSAASPASASPALAEPAHDLAVEIDAELAACEAAFVALDAPADAPERLALFEQLGRIYARLGRLRDAAACFARAAWEAPPDAAAARLDAWLAIYAPRTLGVALAQPAPASEEVYAVALLAARGAAGVAADPHRVTRWLDAHDADLDARTRWLSRVGLARLGGGDALLLARARDRILAQLAGGLPVERELPGFLRLAGRSGALGATSGDHLARALDDLWARVETTRRKRTPLEAPPHLTNAYAALELAYGFARIARTDRARDLVTAAHAALAPQLSDPVHAYAAAAFAARVDQAVAGAPPETPLPDALAAQLAALDRTQRYKIDRLRERSRILSPLDRPDAFRTYIAWSEPANARDLALAQLAPAERVAAIGKLVDDAARAGADRAHLLDRALAALVELPESGAVPILRAAEPLVAAVAPAQRAPLYARALVAAGHFGRTERVPPLVDALRGALAGADAAQLEHVLAHGLRALRRIGLRAEAADLLVAADAERSGTPAQVLRGRLAIAAGLAYLGELPRALPIFERAHAALPGATPPERLDLVRALALAYAQTPLARALAGIAELADLFADISDSASTNSHYCLSVLDFIESLVLGIASDDLALGEAGRRFVEDDEHLIRRRLHDDLTGELGGRA